MSTPPGPTRQELIVAGARIVALEHRRDTLREATRLERVYRRDHRAVALAIAALVLAAIVAHRVKSPNAPEEFDAAALAAAAFAGLAVILTLRPESPPEACVTPDDAARLAGYIYVKQEGSSDEDCPDDGFWLTDRGSRARDAFRELHEQSYT